MEHERRLSEKVKVRFGYSDGHVEVVVEVPIIPDITFRIERDEIAKAINVLHEAELWNERAEREKGRRKG